MFDNLGCIIGADSGESVEGDGVRGVQVDLRDADERLQPSEYGVGHDIGFGEVGRPSEMSTALAVIDDGLRLFLTEAKAHQVAEADSVGVEGERLGAAGDGGLCRGGVRRIAPYDDASAAARPSVSLPSRRFTG